MKNLNICLAMIALVLVLSSAVRADAQSSIAGTWYDATGGWMRVQQSGNTVWGDYKAGRGHEHLYGTFRGTLNGNQMVVDYQNQEDQVRGGGRWVYTLDGNTLQGYYQGSYVYQGHDYPVSGNGSYHR